MDDRNEEHSFISDYNQIHNLYKTYLKKGHIF